MKKGIDEYIKKVKASKTVTGFPESEIREAFRAGVLWERSRSKIKKKCPFCKSAKIIMFDSDNDICDKCGEIFQGS